MAGQQSMNPAPICHIVWDWNGTLLDDAWLCVEIVNQLLARRGMAPISAQRYSEIFGFPLKEYCRRLGFAVEDGAFEALSDEFLELYEARRLECSLQPGAREALEVLKDAGIGQSVLSAYQQHTLEEIIEHFGLGPFFDPVLGLDNPLGQGKINRGVAWMAQASLVPQRVLLCGDLAHDLEVAQAMGICCALIPSGHQVPTTWPVNEAQVMNDLGALLAWLGF